MLLLLRQSEFQSLSNVQFHTVMHFLRSIWPRFNETLTMTGEGVYYYIVLVIVQCILVSCASVRGCHKTKTKNPDLISDSVPILMLDPLLQKHF